MAEEPAQATPAAKPRAPRAPVSKTMEDYQGELERLLARASKDGVNPQRLLARATAKSGLNLFERFTDVVFDALEGSGKKKK